MTNQEPECNDWVYGGNVTTDVPVTGGSGLLCYTGSDNSHQASSSVLPTLVNIFLSEMAKNFG